MALIRLLLCVFINNGAAVGLAAPVDVLSVSQADMERERGVSGIGSTQERLEQASESKASLDEQKGDKLNDMSAMVLRLNEKIAQRKAKLAPIIKGGHGGWRRSVMILGRSIMRELLIYVLYFLYFAD